MRILPRQAGGAASGAGGGRARRAFAAAASLAAAALGLGACAAPGSDIALAPLYTRASTADGGVEVEAAAGLWRQRFEAATGRFESLTVGPLYSLDYRTPERIRRSGPDYGPAALKEESPGDGLGALVDESLAGGRAPERDEDWLSRFLVPFGYTTHNDGETLSTLFPVYLWRSYDLADGRRRRSLATILLTFWRKDEGRPADVAWLPFAGKIDGLFTYEKVRFFLWPLFVYGERDGQVSYHVPWPILGWTRGGGESSDHLLPLYSRATLEGSYKRWALLWPFLHLQYNHLGRGDEAKERAWWVFPLLGRVTRESFRATSVLWPFFGYSSDSRSGFWAWDGPWPFVRIQRGPDDVSRTRFWPFFGHLRAAGLETRSFLWPLIHLREEDQPTYRRTSTWILPVWQRWDRAERDAGEPTGRTAAWRKLFPVFQYEREDQWRRGSFPTLDPFWRNELVDRHYAWLWKLYEWQEDRDAGTRRERVWAGLWRRERDRAEDRASLTFLWSRRRYGSDDGRVAEHAVLFGLFRWRVTAAGGFAMLRPAFPGPGWPTRSGTEPRVPDGSRDDSPTAGDTP